MSDLLNILAIALTSFLSKSLRHCYPIALACPLLLTACANYEFTFNEQIWHSPDPLYLEFQVADQALQQCLEQAVRDSRAKTADEVYRLDCSYADISNLEGLQQFTGIELLKLSNNKISDFAPILFLQQLKKLSLQNNQLSYAGPLLSLKSLEYLDLRGNPSLACAELLEADTATKLKLPEHCQ
jgi:internalin A